MTRDPANFREYAASLACFILIMAAIMLIFALILVPVYTDKPVTMPDSASQFFFGLVMAAIGYLIGKQTTGAINPTINVPVPDNSTTETTVKSGPK